MTKECITCNKELPLSEFYKHKEHRDGLFSECKECHKKRCNQWERNNVIQRAKQHALWKRNNPNKVKEQDIKSRRMNKEKYNARHRVKYALRTGKLIRPDHCSKCNKACKPEAHHEDYSKPLEVVWLCRKCHVSLHKKFGE